MKYSSILLLTFSLALNAEWIDLGSSSPEGYEKRILSSDSDNIRLEFTMYGYYQTLVDTPKFLLTQSMVTGKVAALEEVENASI